MQRNFGLLFLLLIGTAILYFNQEIVDSIDSLLSERDNRPTIAVIQSIDGRVRVKKAKTLKFKNGHQSQELRDQDTLTTDESSRAKISFLSGFEIQVEPNSLIVIEQPQKDSQGRIQITFLKGEFKVLKTGEAGQVVVSKDKKFQDLAGRTPLDPLKIALKDPEIEIQPPPPPAETVLAPAIKQEKLEEKKKIIVEKEEDRPEPPRKPKETLSDDYISQIIASQKPFFERCYTQHLRLNPDSKGIIHLAFTVSPQGKVATVSLVQSTLSDPQLEKCTMAVVERCRFKSFDGDPIVVNYPINFE